MIKRVGDLWVFSTLGPGASGQRSLPSVWERACAEQTAVSTSLFLPLAALLLCAEGAQELQRETHLGAENDLSDMTHYFKHCLRSL